MDDSENIERDQWNDWAFDKQGQTIHVTQVLRGRGEYYCMGCGAVMQAVKPHIANRVPYFRHDSGVIEKSRSCTYGSETYRHKLGKEILQRTKRIKVPALYKFPPKGYDGKKVKLSDSAYVSADKVEIELTFFQTDKGEIKYGRGNQIPRDERFHIIKPDVTFFDKKGFPFLLIELVVTHKVNTDKRAKITQLGLNTIQVKLPPKDAQGIEACFLKSDCTKWIYNELEARTDYFQLPQGTAERISELDEDQRKLLEEDFRCRSAQIGRLIRSIERCLDSKHYRVFEDGIGAEISRVGEEQDGIESKLESIRNDIQERVQEEFRSEEERLKAGKAILGRSKRNLEGRYLEKRREIEEAANESLREEIALGNQKDQLESEEIEFEARTDSESDSNRRLREHLQSEIDGVESDIERERESYANLKRERDGFEERFERLRVEVKRSYQFQESNEQERIGSAIQDLRSKIEGFGKFAGSRRAEIEEQLRSNFERRIEQIHSGTIEGNDSASRGLKETIRGPKLVRDYQEIELEIKRIKSAKEWFDQKAWLGKVERKSVF